MILPARPLSRVFRVLAICGVMMAATPASASDEGTIKVDPTAQLTFRLVQSDLDFDEGEEIDSSGFAVRGEVGLDFDLGETTGARVELEAGHFNYHDATRTDRTSYGGAVEVEQALSETVKMRLRVRRIENVGLLEASSADQTSVGVRFQWEKGNDRVRLYADWRDRDYDLTAPANGQGWRFAAQYNRRLGSYKWLRFDARWEEITSENSPRRNFERTVLRVEYSQPVAKRLRLRPSIEYREWSYDDRIARGDPQRDLRQDSYVAPRLELAYGRSIGLYGEASIEYRLRSSNDVRFDSDAIRAGLTVGFRF